MADGDDVNVEDVNVDTPDVVDTPDTPAVPETPETPETPDATVDQEEAPADEKTTMLSKVESILGIGKKDKEEPKAKEADDASSSADPAPAVDKDVADSEKADASTDGGDEIEVPKEIAEHPAFVKLQEQNEAYAASHERMEVVQNFMTENNLASEDMSAAMNSAAARKQSGVPMNEFDTAENATMLAYSDPEKFYEYITNLQKDVGVVLGKTLPDDLRLAVDEGDMTEEAAKELSVARIEVKKSKAAATTATQANTTRDANDASKKRGDVVNSWFEVNGKKDLSLPTKVDAIQGEILRLKQEADKLNKPYGESPAEITALLDEAYKNVTERMQPPGKKPVGALPRSNQPPVNVETKAQTPKEKMSSDVLNIMNRNAA